MRNREGSMNFDIDHHFGAVQRTVNSVTRDEKAAKTVTLTRSYPTGIDDLWSALTNSERISRWFLPITGDLNLGGRYQFEGNAGVKSENVTHLPFFRLRGSDKTMSAGWKFGLARLERTKPS